MDSARTHTTATHRHRDPHPGDLIDGSCPLCSNEVLLVLPFRYAFQGRYLYGVKCASCSLVFVQPQPTGQEIGDMYSEEYFTECSQTCGAHGREAYMEMIEHSASEQLRKARRLDGLLLNHLKQRGVLLEIGCGPGFLLAELRNLGWGVQGLEISEYAAEYAKEKLNVNVSVGPIQAEICASETFDAVFMGDVLEHLPDPLRSLEAVGTWLKPGGALVIAVPSTLNLLSGRMGVGLYGLRRRFKTLRIPPYHLCEYVPRTLRAMIEASGFRVVEMRQSAVALRKMGLRGSLLENATKASLQVLAHLTSWALNRWGDRLLAVAVKAGS